MAGRAVYPEHLGDLRADLLDRVEADAWVLRDQADTSPRTSRHARSPSPVSSSPLRLRDPAATHST
ncbi:hypothetical protein [Streptomyces sp. AC495_CC817]|uniref:hypothetical protein n=1 Tax=Streptomyces sp. AC495_CC817 TaxID=2823900 RepID=UPI001C257130|nr:hypothetical protein [Streptomyces sp. AC495_CC817]